MNGIMEFAGTNGMLATARELDVAQNDRSTTGQLKFGLLIAHSGEANGS